MVILFYFRFFTSHLQLLETPQRRCLNECKIERYCTDSELLTSRTIPFLLNRTPSLSFTLGKSSRRRLAPDVPKMSGASLKRCSLATHLLLPRIAPVAPATVRLQRFGDRRCLSQTTLRRGNDKDDSRPANAARTDEKRPKTASLLESIYGPSQTAFDQRPAPSSALSSSSTMPPPSSAMANLSQSTVFQALNSKSKIDTSSLSDRSSPSLQPAADDLEPYHLHVYAHKHNTHITCTRPNRNPIISMSCGNIGFRKSRRGTFDSAYSLAKYVIERLSHTGWPPKMRKLELVLRGFGQGREAVVKVLLSPEGKVLRDKIVRVADSTRIKFGGTRSKKPRRL